MDIAEALDHPGLFAPHFAGPSWARWKIFLRALFGLAMDDAALAIYREHTGRIDPPSEPYKEAALVVGRRGGKSRILALIATFLATFKDYTPYLAPGEVATVALIAADRKQARTILRYLTGLLRAVPSLAAMIEEETAETVTLNNRVMIEIHTASFRVTRGYTFAAVLADETAFWRNDDGSANPDVEIFRALRPGLSNIPGAMLLNASSPYRKAGVLYRAFARHFGRNDAPVLVWKGATAEMNPGIDAAIIEEAYADDATSAASEYGAEFRDDIAEFVSREVVEGCVVPGCHERSRIGAVRSYVGFVDAAGGSGSDSMTVGIAHREVDRAVLDVIRERRPPFSPDDVVFEFSLLLRSYNIRRVEADKWGGDWVGEAFRKQGITVEPSAKPKSDIYRDVLPLLNSGKAQLLDVPRLVSQLCGLERRTARGGRDSIDHGPGGHDDLANAAAGVLLLTTAQQPMHISDAFLARITPDPRIPDYMRPDWRIP